MTNTDQPIPTEFVRDDSGKVVGHRLTEPLHPVGRDWIERIRNDNLGRRGRAKARRVAIRVSLAAKLKDAKGRGGPVSLTWELAQSILEELYR